MDLLSLFDELVTVIQPRQEGDESSLPCKDSSILLQVIHIQTERKGERFIKGLITIHESM